MATHKLTLSPHFYFSIGHFCSTTSKANNPKPDGSSAYYFGTLRIRSLWLNYETKTSFCPQTLMVNQKIGFKPKEFTSMLF